jgi:hypothetical protein
VYALNAFRHRFSGALRFRAIDESAERHIALVHGALDVGGIDETVRSQPIVQLFADALVCPPVAAGAAPGKWAGNTPGFHAGQLLAAITCLLVPAAVSMGSELLASTREASRTPIVAVTPLAVHSRRFDHQMTFFAVMIEIEVVELAWGRVGLMVVCHTVLHGLTQQG